MVCLVCLWKALICILVLSYCWCAGQVGPLLGQHESVNYDPGSRYWSAIWGNRQRNVAWNCFPRIYPRREKIGTSNNCRTMHGSCISIIINAIWFFLWGNVGVLFPERNLNTVSFSSLVLVPKCYYGLYGFWSAHAMFFHKKMFCRHTTSE